MHKQLLVGYLDPLTLAQLSSCGLDFAGVTHNILCGSCGDCSYPLRLSGRSYLPVPQAFGVRQYVLLSTAICIPHSRVPMTRKQRQNVTYNLAGPRNLAAFHALLENENDEGDDIVEQSKQKGQGRKAPKAEKPFFFQLREDHQRQQSLRPPTLKGPERSPAQALQDMFGSNCDPGFLEDILQGCAGNLDKAVESVLALGIAKAPGKLPADEAGPSTSQTPGMLAQLMFSSSNLNNDVRQQLPKNYLLHTTHCACLC